MVHLWRKAKDETETSKSAPGVGATGDIAVIVDGKKLDNELVRLACLMAKKAKRKVHLVHIIEVPRTLPLKATLTKESEEADKLLNEALAIADEAGCDAVAEVVQTRDAGPAIVDEAKDHSLALIMEIRIKDIPRATLLVRQYRMSLPMRHAGYGLYRILYYSYLFVCLPL